MSDYQLITVFFCKLIAVVGVAVEQHPKIVLQHLKITLNMGQTEGLENVQNVLLLTSLSSIHFRMSAL
jgi:hypothetical protein